MQINPEIFNKKIEIIKITETKDSDGFPIKNEAVINDYSYEKKYMEIMAEVVTK